MKPLLLILLLCLLSPGLAIGQTVSNAGTEFWAAFPTHVPDHNEDGSVGYANFSIFITGGQASSGLITAGHFSQRFSISPNTVTEIVVPRDQAYIDESEANRVLINRGIHILTDPGKPPVVAYAHIFAANRSAATLLLPVEALGQKYYSINYRQMREGQNFILIVATEPNTRIHIKNKFGDFFPDGLLLENPGDTYELTNTIELSGFSVYVDSATSACKHFAMFSGSSGIPIGRECTTGTLDPLFQQTIPIESWGYTYGFVPFSMVSPNYTYPVRTAGQQVKIVAKENGTAVKIDGSLVATLEESEYYTTPRELTKACIIQASKPVLVAQYALSQSCSMLEPKGDNYNSFSDPDMVVLNPIEFRIKDITLFSSTREHIKEQYINVFMKSSETGTFRINGRIPPQAFKPLDNNPEYSSVQLTVNNDSTNTFHLQAQEGFNAVAYGFGRYESYAYSAGTNLAASQSLAAFKKPGNVQIDSACVEDDYFFRLTLPYKTPKLSWQLDRNEIPVIQNMPAAREITSNGIPAYEYDFPKTDAYGIAGLHQIHIIADYPATLGGCSTGTQQIDGDFRVLPAPSPSFTQLIAYCENIATFFDNTPVTDHVVKWDWDFADTANASTSHSSLQNPQHRFSGPGTYPVSLTTTNASGCSMTKTINIPIEKYIVPGFIAPSSACLNMPVILSDTSHSPSFVIKTRKWFFGDGQMVQTDHDTNISHTYTQPGTYLIKMALYSNHDCLSDTATATIQIGDVIKADFNDIPSCAGDPFTSFKNNSTAPSPGFALTYHWDFGDLAAQANGTNQSALYEPTHHYPAAGLYHTTLIVTSSAGCADTLLKEVIVNGGSPKADFEVPAPAEICQGTPLILTDRSNVTDFGSVSSIEWVFDAADHPEEKKAYDHIVTGTRYTHTYPPLPDGINSKEYIVRQYAYSGTSCVDFAEKTITVKRGPKAFIPVLSSVCVNGTPFQITGAKDLSGLPGSGIFNGTGITPAGWFNPSVAGSGTHTIHFIFTNAGGCSDTASGALKVLPLPQTHVAQTLTILEREQTYLNPAGHNDGLSYHWSPPLGLNADNIANPLASPPETTVYHFTATNGLCETTGEITLHVTPNVEIVKGFTPNGDGVNDELKITNLEQYPGTAVFIYTRWGTEIFHSVGYPKPWDGRYKGKDMPTGVYYYIISIRGRESLRGTVTLLR